jgi:hypothetical protein
MNGRLLYHQNLVKTTVGNVTAYSDDFSGNQDPYIWQKVFLHTYCHMGQMRKGFNKPKDHPEVEIGDINFWITSAVRGDYSKLYCDLVFVVADKLYWPTPNHIDRNDPPAKSDSVAAFEEHYAWVKQHCFSDKKIKKYRRFTLKADPLKSFQPQDVHGNLLDIRPLLDELDVDIIALEKALGPKVRGSFSLPFPLKAQVACALYAKIREKEFAPVLLTGADFGHPDFEKKRKSRKRQQRPRNCS